MKLLLWLSTLRLEPAVDVAVGSILKKTAQRKVIRKTQRRLTSPWYGMILWLSSLGVRLRGLVRFMAAL